jgi:hypothetical protein
MSQIIMAERAPAEWQFTATRQQLKRSTRTKVFCNGVEIGSRTSLNRDYKFALVVLRNQDREIVRLKGFIAVTEQLACTYTDLLLDAPGCRDKWFKTDARNQALMRQWIADGTVAQWIAHCTDQVKTLTERLALLESGPHTDYTTPFVLSWHTRLVNVPTPPESYTVVRIVPLP